MGIIYKATNKKNGKIYIGQTILTLEERKKSHKDAMKRINTYFYNSLRKYGWKNFKWEVIYECSNEKLNEAECWFIKKYNSTMDGYNTTYGGSIKLTNKSIEKMRKSKRGKKHTEQHKNNIGNSVRNIPRTEKWNEKNRQKHLKYLWLIQKPDSKIIYVLNLKKFCKNIRISFSWLTENKSCRGYKILEKIENFIYSN